MDWFPDFVMKYLNFTGKCFRHCEEPTSMTVIFRNEKSLVGAYVCPDAFVSQVVYFSLKADAEWFRDLLSSQVGKENVSNKDIRIASRHGWELGDGALDTLESKLGPGVPVKEIYWTRYPSTEAEKEQAVSICIGDLSKKGCMRLFMHNRNSVQKLCPACRAK